MSGIPCCSSWISICIKLAASQLLGTASSSALEAVLLAPDEVVGADVDEFACPPVPADAVAWASADCLRSLHLLAFINVPILLGFCVPFITVCRNVGCRSTYKAFALHLSE